MLHVPQIDHELAESLRMLAELEACLPAIRTHWQVAQVRLVYDSGRQKVDLRWLNRGWYERWPQWYEVIFTSESPVSWRWRATLRTLFALAMVAAWMTSVTLLGVTRAHRQRLVWGERLPS
ncbi:hypothetical protein BJV78DRAFT_1129276 [Lactifluus subvellereus]|nr:hypothetical protein BJV78DRAFT_1129276 [Lactifluus subvellereus]